MRAVLSFGKTLFSRWKDSLSFFKPSEFSTIWLLTLKTASRAWWLITLYIVWWLLFPACYSDLLAGGNAIYGRFFEFITPLLLHPNNIVKIYIFTAMLFTFFALLSVRASFEQKKGSYYVSYLPRLFYFAFAFLIMPHTYTVPFWWLGMLFFLDRENSFGSLLRSLKDGLVMAISYLPVFGSMGAVHLGIYGGMRWFWDQTHIEENFFSAYMLKFYVFVLLQILFFSMLAVLYIKISHGNKKLFVKKAPAKRAPAKKTAAKKTSAKKETTAPAKKAAAKKPRKAVKRGPKKTTSGKYKMSARRNRTPKA